MNIWSWRRFAGLCRAGLTDGDLFAIGVLYGERHWSRIAYRVTAGGEA